MKRILTGDRPTGRLHVGHYAGSLQNRVRLQRDYETFIIIADVQALTTHFDKPEMLMKNVYEIAIDNLSIGIDPEVSKIFIQSKIPQIAELTVFFSMFVSTNVLRHNPTIKSEAMQYGYKDLTYGFLGYPVSQAADITFCNADLVPCGDDQLPHLELTRKIVRRFNSLYRSVLTEPEALLGNCPRLPGTDGNSKMGKSLGNAIYLSDSAEEVAQKLKGAKTDTNRITVKDKGNPDLCTVYQYQRVFNSSECDNISEMCKSAGIGCVACKRSLTNSMNNILDPIREKRKYYEENLDLVKEIIYSGNEFVRNVAEDNMKKIREAMNMDY